MLKLLFFATFAIGLTACQSTSSGKGPEIALSERPSSASPAKQQGSERSTRVFAFVQAACAGCHGVEPLQLSPNPAAPPFEDIANREGLTAETLSTWLRDAHNYPEEMEFSLDGSEVDELTAYLLSLRDVNYKRPTY